jgi:hypothetical protein
MTRVQKTRTRKTRGSQPEPLTPETFRDDEIARAKAHAASARKPFRQPRQN